MAKMVLRQALLAFCIFLSCTELLATHIIGGDLTYKCVGSKRYKIILTVYTECGSEAILEQKYPIQYYATDLGIEASNPLVFEVFKVSTQEVQLFCEGYVTNCAGGSHRGVEKVVYEGTVNLSSHGLSEDWRFFWKRAARSEEIKTLVLPEAEDFFIEASINNKLASCNQSVVFEGSAVATVCINQSQTFNNLATDPDGDQLKFTLETPKSNYDADVVFSDGYNATNFMAFSGSPVLNVSSGDLTINPTLLITGITDFKVEEFRNGQSIGWVKRGIQLTSIDCSNAIPVISDFKTINSETVNICAGETINLDFDVEDADNENILVTQVDGPAGIFSVLNNNSPSPTGRILWHTGYADAGVYNVVVQASDKKCPQPGVALKTFVLNVRSSPQFSLGGYQVIACDETLELKPTVTGGDGNYTYLWNDGSTGSTNIVGVGSHSLKVTDGTGCSYTSSTYINDELFANFDVSPRCIGMPAEFTDQSYHQNSSKDIVSWSWDFGDGNTSTEQNPEHTYAVAGNYQVTLEITDNGAVPCSESITKDITICDPPPFNFTLDGHCTYSPVTLQAIFAGINECTFMQTLVYDFGDGTVQTCNLASLPPCINVQHVYNAAGTYNVSVTALSLSGCENTITKSIKIDPSPEVNIIQDNFYLVCSNPDSLLETEILAGGTGAIAYQWSTNETTEDININSSGYYTVTATDEVGCSLSDDVMVTYPLSAHFRYDPFCKPGDIVKFYANAASQTNTVTSYTWNFDDPGSGAANTSTDITPQHEFSQEGDYNVRLEVEDSDGCYHNFVWPVYNTSIDNHFEIDPSEEVCQGGQVTGTGPSGSHVDSYVWNFGDGYAYSKISPHFYNSAGNFDINLRVDYNNNSLANGHCTSEFNEDISVNARPAVQIKASQDRFCMYQPITFEVETESDIQAVEWEVTNLRKGTTVTSNEISFTHQFTERADYRVGLSATDVNGCTSYSSMSGFAARVVIPDFNFEILCAKEILTFEEAFRDTLENITDYRWDFGDGTILEGPVPIPVTTHVFEKGGIYPVTLTVINSFSGCGNSKTKMVTVIKAPVIDFSYDTICARSEMSFTNLTTEGEGSIESYSWQFPDGSTVNTKDASFYFEEPGNFPVSLIATSSVGCIDTLTQSVYVKPAPVAGVEITVPFVEAYIPVQFYDDSEGDIISYYWDFGDGTTTTERDPIHTYDAIEKYPLTHVVTNGYNCSDTLNLPLDLNVYLDLPTAFSPNNDGQNDQLRLVQQGIKTLYTYKIFNRHGQEVFDALGNVQALWDGTYNGRPQPSGVYVAHVKATGAYGKEFNFKRNVTLLR